RLRSLDGFIKTERAQLPHYQRPYYEYKIELAPAASEHTIVKVKANVSAWYEDPESHQSGYQALESNGRLENDLLDRLADYLANNGSKIITDPQELAKRLEAVRQQRVEAERRVAELENHMQGLTSIREVPSTFSGDWPRLKGKQALYIWARPEGSVLNEAGSKLRFAESIFKERYREASHNSQNSVAGIVVIFLDQRGGVA